MANPADDLLKELKREEKARKDAERASSDFARELLEEEAATVKATTALGKFKEILLDLGKEITGKGNKGGADAGGGKMNAINTFAGILSNLGSGKVAATGTALSSLTNNIEKLGKEGGSGKVGAALGALGAGKQLATQGLGAMAGALKSVGSVASLASAALGPMGALLGSTTGMLTAPIDAIKGLTDSLVSFVSLVNPGVVQQFTFALNDAFAVIGGMLTPVLQGVTQYVRAYGDALAGLVPVMQPLFDAIGQAFADFAPIIKEMVAAYAPFIQLLVDVMVPVIKQLTEGFAYFYGILAEVLKTIAGIFGLESRFDPNKTSKGAAVRSTSVNTVESFANAQFAKSIQGIFAGGQGKNPEQQREEIKKALAEGRKVVEEIRDAVNVVANWIRNAGGIPGVKLLSAVGDAASDAGSWVERRGADAAEAWNDIKGWFR